jgi:hypothetical protein
MPKGLMVFGAAMGLSIAWMDTQPGWDDSGISAMAVLLLALLLGLVHPRRAWVWGLCAGLWVPLLGIVLHRNLGSLLALVFAFGGAIAGSSVRRSFDDLVGEVPPSHQTHSHL